MTTALPPFPTSLPAFQRAFADDGACLAYMEEDRLMTCIDCGAESVLSPVCDLHDLFRRRRRDPVPREAILRAHVIMHRLIEQLGGAAPVDDESFGTTRALTMEQAREIRRRRAAGERGAALAREFGIDPGAITRIVKGRSYRETTP